MGLAKKGLIKSDKTLEQLEFDYENGLGSGYKYYKLKAGPKRILKKAKGEIPWFFRIPNPSWV